MEKQTVRQALTEARALLSDPAKWTKGTFARDKDNLPVPVRAEFPEAVCFCSAGALRKVCRPDPTEFWGETCYWQAIEVLDGAVDGSIVFVNDAEATTHADVLAIFDKAIAACPEVSHV